MPMSPNFRDSGLSSILSPVHERKSWNTKAPKRGFVNVWSLEAKDDYDVQGCKVSKPTESVRAVVQGEKDSPNRHPLTVLVAMRLN